MSTLVFLYTLFPSTFSLISRVKCVFNTCLLSQNAQDTDPRMPEKGGDRSLTRLFRWDFRFLSLLAILLVVFLLIGLGAVERQKNPTDYGEFSLG